MHTTTLPSSFAISKSPYVRLNLCIARSRGQMKVIEYIMFYSLLGVIFFGLIYLVCI